jgi:hypothetical protein
MSFHDQWIRKFSLYIYSEKKALDLSNMHVRFDIQNADIESPNSASIRVYNLSHETTQLILQQGEFSTVVLNAGYVGGNFGMVFTGTIKQYRVGKESAIDTYLDILAGDGDIPYNQGFINETLAAGTTHVQAINSAAKAMGLEADLGSLKADEQHVPSLRGKVRFGLARSYMRHSAQTLDAGWSIQNGVVQFVDNKGYQEGEKIFLNAGTGLIGVPEQTGEGIRLRCLLNSKLRVGGLVQVSNKDINQLMSAKKDGGQVAYDSRTQLIPLVPLSEDGSYRLMAVEHSGDTRGNDWYSNLVGLAFDPVSNTTVAK